MGLNFNRIEKVFEALKTLNHTTVEVSAIIASIVKDMNVSEFYDEAQDVNDTIFFVCTFCGVDVFVNTHRKFEDRRVIANGVTVYDFVELNINDI